MNFGSTFKGASADVLTALSFLSIFLSLAVVAMRRKGRNYRRSLVLLALAALFIGVNQILGVTGASRLQSWWSVAAAAFSVVAAMLIISALPQYLRSRKVAEELRGQAGFLDEQQALQQAIQDSVSDGIILIGAEGQIKAFNPAALRILFGQNQTELKLKPDMKERALRALAGQSNQDIVEWEGRSIERFTTSVPGYGRLYVFRDITARRRLEEQRLRLERVIAGMKEGFAIVSFDTMQIISANPAMEQMLGYEKNDLAGRHFSMIHAGKEAERRAAVESIKRAASLDGFWEGEIRNQRKDGSELITHTTINLAREGESQYLSCLQVNITAQKRLQEEKERLESLGRLAEGAGHEFNNLLTGIMGNAGMALERLPAGHPVAAMLEDVLRAGERAAAISRQLLAFSGKTGGLVMDPVNLSDLVENVAGLAQASISQRVQFRMELEREIPLVEADEIQIRQVALNLIANAAESIGEGAGLVRVRTGFEHLDSGPFVFFEVCDDGCGMDEENKSHIFDGLGLATALGIVRAHGGAVKVSSAPGKGSAFRVLLPAAAAGPELDRFTARGVILVIEDELTVRRATVAALSHYGFEVRSAENGQIGVEVFQEMADRIQLVLMGGEEALARIKGIRPDVPIVISSGHSERFKASGVDGFIMKPYSARQLMETLKTILNQQAPGRSAKVAGAG